MADNQNHQLNTDQIRELLSPYLDGEVTDEERVLVEQALAASAELQLELETLRRTIALVTALPPVPAPRPFTLTAADVPATLPGSKSFFGLPAWFKAWAALAATLLCVLVAGGLFWSMQFGQVSQEAAAPAAEIASAPESVATATDTEVQSAAAPAESAAQQEPEPAPTEAEEMMMAEPAITEEVAPAAEENMADAVQEKALTATPTTTESAAANLAQAPTDEAAQEAAPAGEPATAESQAITAAEADQSTPAEDSAIGGAGPAASPSVPTASPAPETLTFAAPATEAVEEEAASAAAAESEQAATESAAPPAPAELAQPGLQERGALPRLVEVENLKLDISPGLIQVRGMIEAAAPGSTLSATLQRNGESFDIWADPATLQTVVQPTGQFALDIRASAGRTDQDLFAMEPASYQINLTSSDGTEPLMAVVPFDTFPPPAVATPTATSSPQPSATPLARLTLPPPDTPIGTPTIVAPEEVSPNAPGWLMPLSLATLGALVVIIGLVVWFIRHYQKRGPR